MNKSVEERSGCDDDGLRSDSAAVAQLDAADNTPLLALRRWLLAARRQGLNLIPSQNFSPSRGTCDSRQTGFLDLYWIPVTICGTEGPSARTRSVGRDPGLDDSRFSQLLVAGCSALLTDNFLNNQIRYFRLLDREIGLGFQDFAHFQPVLLLVALRPWRPDGRSARGVQEAELDADRIGNLPHDAAKCIHFADEVAFGDTADSGVTRHLGNQVDIERVERGLQAHASRSHGGFASGMTGADHNNVVRFGELHGENDLSSLQRMPLF